MEVLGHSGGGDASVFESECRTGDPCRLASRILPSIFIELPEFFDTAFSMMDMEEENALKEFLVGALCGKNDNTSYLYFHVAEILPIQNLVENMVWTIFYDQPNKRRCNQITMGLLLLQLLNHMDRMETGTAAFDRELTGSVFNYIEEHYKNGSLSELAEIMGYDVYWLSREIKKRTGKTYKRAASVEKNASGGIFAEEQQAVGGGYH